MTALLTPTARQGLITDNAMKILKQRYLEPDETVEGLFRRVSGGDDRFQRLMQNLDVLPNSPTLMNKGTGKKGTSSACFVFDVADSMLEGNDSIMGTATKAAAVAKWGGGVGYYLGDLRSAGSPIQTTHKVACGPIGVLKFYNEIAKLITQGGRRDLAQMAVLNCNHPDIRDFIHVKDNNPQALRTFNISVSVTDDFMTKALLTGTSEQALWKEIIDSAWKTGDPGLFFVDTVNKYNPTPHLGRLNACNPCGEQPLLGAYLDKGKLCSGGEACNLAAINLANFVTVNREVDWNRLEEVAEQSIWFLDHILETNMFPHPDIEKAVRLTQKISTGVMGWADMLAMMHIHYDTDEAILLADKVMRFINEIARETSIKIAKVKGPYPGSNGDPCRHAVRTNVAPTGTISIIAGCSSGIEPHYSLEWDRTVNAGSEGLKEYVIQERIAVLDRLEGFVPKVSGQIDWRWHVKHQSAFQTHLNQACSKTINLPNSATHEDVAGAYEMMWRLGCKGGTIFRDGCRKGGEQVLKTKEPTSMHVNGNSHAKKISYKAEERSGPSLSEVVIAHINASNGKCRRKPSKERKSITHHITIGEFDGYIHAGVYDDGSLCEIFLTASKEGSTVSGLLDSWAIAVSHALQYGDPLEDLVKKYSGMRFEPSGMTHNPEIPICTSVVDYIMRWLDKRFGYGRLDSAYKGHEVDSGQMCPDCQGPAIFQGGCLTCKKGCGYSRCG